MCLDTNVTSTVPTKFKVWFKQRQRWSMGGLQTIGKYKAHFLRRDTMVGNFILPFFILSTFLGLLGLTIFTYLLTSRLIKNYLLVKFSYVANTAVITMEQFYFTPSVLNYLGIVLFIMGAAFTIMILVLMKEEVFKRKSIVKILIYLTFYLLLYPVIMITAIFKLIRKDMTW